MVASRSDTIEHAKGDRKGDSGGEVLDLQHLGKYTGGDEALRRELLALFSEQLSRQISVLRENGAQEDWLIATHTLKGAARAVGAWQIAETAEALERIDPANLTDQCRELIARLAQQADDCRAVIEQLSQAA